MAKPKRRYTQRPRLTSKPRLGRVLGHIALNPASIRPYAQTLQIAGNGRVLRVRGARLETPDYDKLAQAVLDMAYRLAGLPPLRDRDQIAIQQHREGKAAKRAGLGARPDDVAIERRIAELRSAPRAEYDRLIKDLGLGES